MNTKKTYSELISVVNRINFHLQNGESTKGQKKLAKVVNLWKPIIDGYNEKLEDIRLDLASTDKHDNLILDEKGGYTYNKANIKLLNEKIKALLSEEVEVKVIEVVNPQGLEVYSFLKDYLNGVEFVEELEEEDVEL